MVMSVGEFFPKGRMVSTLSSHFVFYSTVIIAALT